MVQFYLDASTTDLVYYLVVLFNVFFFYALAIFAHELGHLYGFFKAGKRNVRLRYNGKSLLVGSQEDYDELTDKEYERIVMGGIVGGFLVIVAATILYTPLFLLSLPYFVGCRDDMRIAMRNIE